MVTTAVTPGFAGHGDGLVAGIEAVQRPQLRGEGIAGFVEVIALDAGTFLLEAEAGVQVDQAGKQVFALRVQVARLLLDAGHVA